MRGHILDEAQEALLAREREVLERLRAALAGVKASDDDLDTLGASIRQLDELFLLVVVGEFNSGKSTLINALLGQELLEEGVTPTTAQIQRLGWAEKTGRRVGVDPGVVEIGAPVELLRHLHVVDTPGTNALERRHEALTEEFLPRSDLVLFVTSADRPFTDSERAFMERIRDWGKKVVVVVNKIDILRSDDELERIRTFIAEASRRLLGMSPEIFCLSARRALSAKTEAEGSADLADSRLGELERFVEETLDDAQRLRLKLANPLGVGLLLAGRYLAGVRQSLELLAADVGALEEIDRQLDLFREDLEREFRFRLADVDNALHDFERRGLEYFDETMRLPRFFDLLNKERLAAEFERKVVADLPQTVETKVEEVIDWMVASELRQWEAVREHLERRRAAHPDRLVGRIGSFEYDRQQLLDTVGRAAQRSIDRYDQRAEARRMADSVQQAVASTALIEVGAIGLGTAVTLIATTQLADVTGLVAAGGMAILGLFVIPARRRAAKRELASKIAELRSQLVEALTEQFGREVERSLQRIREAVAPYSRFVRSEQEHLQEARDSLDGLGREMAGLRAEVERT